MMEMAEFPRTPRHRKRTKGQKFTQFFRSLFHTIRSTIGVVMDSIQAQVRKDRVFGTAMAVGVIFTIAAIAVAPGSMFVAVIAFLVAIYAYLK